MAEAQTQEKTAVKKTVQSTGLLAAVLIRGLIGTRAPVRDTLMMLNLRKKHTCVIVKDTVHARGMLTKAKDFVAFGPVTKETVDALSKARKPIAKKKDTSVFALAPPKGGFERKGIKKSFTQGGALGARKEMDTLLKKMM